MRMPHEQVLDHPSISERAFDRTQLRRARWAGKGGRLGHAGAGCLPCSTCVRLPSSRVPRGRRLRPHGAGRRPRRSRPIYIGESRSPDHPTHPATNNMAMVVTALATSAAFQASAPTARPLTRAAAAPLMSAADGMCAPPPAHTRSGEERAAAAPRSSARRARRPPDRPRALASHLRALAGRARRTRRALRSGIRSSSPTSARPRRSPGSATRS